MASVLGAWLVARSCSPWICTGPGATSTCCWPVCFAALRALALGGYGGFLQAGLAVLTALTLVALGALGARVFAALRPQPLSTPTPRRGGHSWPPAVPLVVPADRWSWMPRTEACTASPGGRAPS